MQVLYSESWAHLHCHSSRSWRLGRPGFHWNLIYGTVYICADILPHTPKEVL
jgi:hypothetical protein